MNRYSRPCLSKMIWTKINSNLIHMFAPQLICPSTKLPFRQLYSYQQCDAKGILQIFSITYIHTYIAKLENQISSLKLVNWDFIKLWQNKNDQTFVVMLGFCISFFAAGSWCKLKQNIEKPSITTKDWPIIFLTGL
jgi:hypothetical protein